MTLFLFLGALFLITGLLFLVNPAIISKVNSWGAKSIFICDGIEKKPVKSGLIFLVAAILMFIFAYLVIEWNLSEFLKKIIL